MSWDRAEQILGTIWSTVIDTALLVVATAVVAWPTMTVLGGLHLDMSPAIPALGYRLTWLILTTATLIWSLFVAVGTITREYTK